jgi:membrane protein required for beta-lactamase induction
VGIQRYLNIRFSLSEFDWFKPYRAMLEKSLGQSGMMKGYIGLAIAVLPIAILAWLINAIFGGSLAFGFVIGAIILFYCLDARDLSNQISNYLSGGKKEKGKAPEEELKEFLKDSLPSSETEKARAVSSKVLIWSQHHVFSVIFWYLLFGVFGAVIYYLVHRLSHEALKKDSDAAAYADSAQVVQSVMDWVPVRLAGLSFGAVGAFSNVFNQWMKNIAGGLDTEQKLPVIFGLSAVNADIEKSDKANVEENKGVLDVVFKAEFVWIAAIALISLIMLI